jgi:hypothetical protein
MTTPVSRWRWLWALLASVWILPISCTMSAVVGTNLVYFAAPVHYAEGATDIDAGFQVVIQPGRQQQEAEVISLRELARARVDQPQLSLKVSQPSAHSPHEENTEGGWSYSVVGSTPNGWQTIEVEVEGGTSRHYSRYRTDGRSVIPEEYSRTSVGHMFNAMLIGAVMGLLLMALGKTLKSD